MKLSEKLSGSIYRLVAKPYLSAFEELSIERVLRKSIKLLDAESINSIKDFVKGGQTDSGGFADRAGKPDLYYTLFGCFLAEALDMPELLDPVNEYLHSQVNKNNTEGIYLHCASILSAKLENEACLSPLRQKLIEKLTADEGALQEYNAFMALLSCYYLKYYKGLYLTSRNLKRVVRQGELPSTVLAASLVLQKSFRKNVDKLESELLSFYDGKGGFRATRRAPVPDLLSTAVVLYSLHFAGFGFRMIKPACLTFVDALFAEGGFCGTIHDPDPDMEYTFYGLLALGSLSE